MQVFYKLIYNPRINLVLRSLIKRLLPILPKGLKIPISGKFTIENKQGKTLIINTNQTSYVSRLLYWEGYLNFEYSDIFIELIKKVKVFYDVGSNIGYYSLLAEMENKNIKIIAFEPASGPLHYLKENVKLNNFKNIQIENIALSEKNGTIEFYEIKNQKYSYLKHNLAGEGNAGSKTKHRNFVPIKVKTKTFNDFVEEKSHGPIDLIKIDTEGTEHLILKNADVILSQMKPIVICETLFNTIEAELEAIFKKYDYEFYNHTENGLQKVNTIVRNQDDGVRNCFFIHPTKLNFIDNFIL
tara:strand:- start:341 stop:1237 length:897 start_codon:yes stop_codon:yes gene_type:complete